MYSTVLYTVYSNYTSTSMYMYLMSFIAFRVRLDDRLDHCILGSQFLIACLMIDNDCAKNFTH